MPGELPGELLGDVRVVDLTDDYGAFATRLLADLGAEVVRVEPAQGGRGRARFPRTPEGTSLHHVHRNQGKDLVQTDDPHVVDGLLAGADLALVGPAGVPGSASLADAAARHPHLVLVSLTAFGVSGDTSGWRATELVAQSLAGVVYRSGVADLPPVSAPGSYCEDVGATTAAVAALTALHRAQQTGRGELVDVSAILALAQCTDMSLPLWSLLRGDQVRAGAGLYPLLPCADGLARIVLPMSTREWRSLIVWLGAPPEWTGPEWDKPILGPAERELVMARLAERFEGSTREQLAADGDAAGVRITPVLEPAEVLSNEHGVARASFVPVTVDGHEGRLPGPLLGVDGERSRQARPLRRLDAPPSWPARTRDLQAASPGLPLAGIRVLEIGTGVAAPEAGRVLSEWGAEVIKVESRRRMDFQRGVLGSDMNPAFASANRNKLGFGADLANPAGQELVRKLVPHVDVVIENNATGVLAKLGLGWERLSQLNPRLVLVGTQLYGDRGPWAAKKGYGPSARAIGGLTWLWAHGPDAPRGVMTIHPDHLAGRLVALGALAGLHARGRSGQGCRIDLAQFEAVSCLLGDILLAESLAAGAAQPQGNRSPEGAPWGTFRCADDDTGAQRWLAVSVPDDATWTALLTVAPTDLDRPQWSTVAGRRVEQTELETALAGWLRDKTAPDVELRLQAAGVPAGETVFPRMSVEHPLYRAREYAVPVDQPGNGTILLEGPAVRTAMGVPRCDPAPLLGEHTASICRDLLGMDDAAIEQLVNSGAIDPLVGETPST